MAGQRTINLRVSVEVLARIDAAAKFAEMTRTELLLGPWLEESPKEKVQVVDLAKDRSPVLGDVWSPPKREVPPTKVHDGGTYTGEVVKNVPLSGEKAARLEAARAAMASVQFGPTPRPPGSMLIDKGKGKR